MPLICKAVGKSDKGLVRPGNEDYLHLDNKNKVFLVCDGMGGHQAGEVASMSAAELINTAFNYYQKELSEDKALDIGHTVPESGDILVKSIRLANREIYNRAQSDTSLSGMGTTVVATVFGDDYMSIAHVGDSRAYRIEERGLVQLTTDHSWVQELQDSQRITLAESDFTVGKNVITRALGVRKDVEVDYRLEKIKPGDVFMLCSDGLCGFADDDEIFEAVKRSDEDIEKMTELLVDMANDRGGMDNVTVAVIRVEDVDVSPIVNCKPITVTSESEELLTAEDQWLQRFQIKRQELEEQNETNYSTRKPANKSILLAIFAGFIIIVAVILLLASIK